MNLKRGWRLASPTEKRQAEADRSFSHLSQIADFSPECSVVHTFPISSEKAHKSAHRLQQVTGCLNEAKPFSLINAMQFLSIEIRGNPAVVIIVLIVLIVIPILNLFCYQKFINYTGRTRLIFTNIYVINISD